MPAVRSATITRQVLDFSRGINRTADRFGLEDREAWWLENFQPIGPGTLRAIPGPGPVLVTLPSAVASLWGVVLGPQRRLIAVGTDGRLSAIDPDTAAVTTIAAPGTFSADARLSVWRDELVLIADPTGGYASWDGTTLVRYPHTRTGTLTAGSTVVTNVTPNTTGLRPTVGVAGTGVPLGARIVSIDSATQFTMDQAATASGTGVTLTFGEGAPPAPRDVAVFEDRVWLVSGTRGLTVTAPTAYADFALANAAMTMTLTDSAFPGAITRIISSLQQLWVFGPAAVSVVGNVRVGGTPVTTLANVVNVVSNLGTPATAWASVTPFFRSMLFMTQFGAHAIVGATPQKISERIDQLIARIDFTRPVVAAVGTLHAVYTWLAKVRWVDPEGPVGDKLLAFARGIWYVIDVGPVDWITTLPSLTTGEMEVWAATGAEIRRLFTGGALRAELRTKLWDFGDFAQGKRLLRVAVAGQSDAGDVPVTVEAESERGSVGSRTIVLTHRATWRDEDGVGVTWRDETGAVVTWATGGIDYDAVALPVGANWIGFRLTATAASWTLAGLAMELAPLGEWAKGTA